VIKSIIQNPIHQHQIDAIGQRPIERLLIIRHPHRNARPGGRNGHPLMIDD